MNIGQVTWTASSVVEHFIDIEEVVGSIPTPSTMCYLYILQSPKNQTYYVGSTNDLKRRLDEHKSGQSNYTNKILPIKLVFKQKFSTLQLARKAELWLKRQKGKTLIVQIINDGKISKQF